LSAEIRRPASTTRVSSDENERVYKRVKLRARCGYFGSVIVPVDSEASFHEIRCPYSDCKKGGTRPVHYFSLETGLIEKTVYQNAPDPGEILGLTMEKQDGNVR
jgi:hypothetical protein